MTIYVILSFVSLNFIPVSLVFTPTLPYQSSPSSLLISGGICLQKFMEIVCTDCTRLRHSYWIVIFGSTQFLLSHLPNFNSVYGVSLVAAVMSLCYSTIAWPGCLCKGRQPDVSYAYTKTSGAESIFRVFNALGQILFTYAGHAVALEIQATIPSTPGKPSRVAMWKGVIGVYFVNVVCYIENSSSFSLSATITVSRTTIFRTFCCLFHMMEVPPATTTMAEDCCVKVAVHIRPLIGDEKLQACKDCVVVVPGKPQVIYPSFTHNVT